MHCYGSSRWGDVKQTQELVKGTKEIVVPCRFHITEWGKLKLVLSTCITYISLESKSSWHSSTCPSPHLNMLTSERLIRILSFVLCYHSKEKEEERFCLSFLWFPLSKPWNLYFILSKFPYFRCLLLLFCLASWSLHSSLWFIMKCVIFKCPYCLKMKDKSRTAYEQILSTTESSTMETTL